MDGTARISDRSPGCTAKAPGSSAVVDEAHDGRGVRRIGGSTSRILLAKMGGDGHDRGQKVVATRWPTSVGTSTSTRCSRHRRAAPAVEADVHVVAASSLAAGHLTLVPELKAALDELGRPDIMIVVGGVIPPQDYDELYEAGASAIFPPGSVISESAKDLLEKLIARRSDS